jgi:hypothetical protein
VTVAHYPAISTSPARDAATMREQIVATIQRLTVLREARADGYPVHLTTDPTWLVDTAINRRAGWPEDPHARVTVNAPTLTRKMTGDAERELRQLADRINTPRLIVRERELGAWRRYLMRRIPNRITRPDEE